MTARIARTRAWGFPTSPRSPKKLLNELPALIPFDGRDWNSEAQREFSNILQTVEGFEGDEPTADNDFAARDRVNRAPRLLGFVYTKPKGAPPGTDKRLFFTEIGRLFIESDEQDCWRIFREQLYKIRFGSPIHRTGGYEDFRVSPLYVMTVVLEAVNFLTKQEIGLFVLTIRNHGEIEGAITRILSYRARFGAAPRKDRQILEEQKDYINGYLTNAIYADDIVEGRTFTREGTGNFIKKKLATLKDYSDATIRYFQAAEFIEFSASGRSIKLSESAQQDTDFIKTNLKDIENYYSMDPKEYVLDFLGKPNSVILPSLVASQDKKELIALVSNLSDADIRANFLGKLSVASAATTPRIYDELNHLLRIQRNREMSQSIHLNATEKIPEIMEMFADIESRNSEILDKPLFLEWNTWRSFSALNHHVEIMPNLKLDLTGNPISTAPGKMPDSMVIYSDYVLVCEVTLSRGSTQYRMEGEPVPRHVGVVQKELRERGDETPVFGLFIAPQISLDCAIYFKSLARMPDRHFGGHVRVLPVSISVFKQFLGISSGDDGVVHPRTLLSAMEMAFTDDFLDKDVDEWVKSIEGLIKAPPIIEYVN